LRREAVTEVREFTPVLLAREARQPDRRMISDVLRQQEIHYDVEAEPHVVLRPSAPWVEARGWLDFVGGWHYYAQPPGDSAWWNSSIAPTGSGEMYVNLINLTPSAMYLVAIDVSCSYDGPNPAIRLAQATLPTRLWRRNLTRRSWSSSPPM
jgi:hypothetical protein